MKPALIITDPKRMAEIIRNQPRVSAARKRQSILAQNGKPTIGDIYLRAMLPAVLPVT